MSSCQDSLILSGLRKSWPYMCVFVHKSFWTSQTEVFSESAGVPEAGGCKTVVLCTYWPLWTGYSQVYMSKASVQAHTNSGMSFVTDKLLWPSGHRSRVPEFADEWSDDMVMWRVCVSLMNDSTLHLHIIFYFALLSAGLHSLERAWERDSERKGKTEGKGNKISTDPWSFCRGRCCRCVVFAST